MNIFPKNTYHSLQPIESLRSTSLLQSAHKCDEGVREGEEESRFTYASEFDLLRDAISPEPILE